MASKVVGDDPDSCIPAPLKDFVFDLHDSARRSQLPAEQGTLYSGVFRDLSAKVCVSSHFAVCDVLYAKSMSMSILLNEFIYLDLKYLFESFNSH